MTTIMITRHHNGFANVDDTFAIGNHEADGAASLAEYALPADYTVAAEGFVRDADGIECGIFLGQHGGPILVSMVGNCPDAILRAV